jgi:hypothetical protein
MEGGGRGQCEITLREFVRRECGKPRRPNCQRCETEREISADINLMFRGEDKSCMAVSLSSETACHDFVGFLSPSKQMPK